MVICVLWFTLSYPCYVVKRGCACVVVCVVVGALYGVSCGVLVGVDLIYTSDRLPT